MVAVAKAAARGIRNHNPGNIERRKNVRWQGMAADQSSDPRFIVFEHPKWGIRAIAVTVRTYQDKRQAADGSPIDTVAEIIHRWAPPAENRTGVYAAHVAKLLRVGVDDQIDVYDWDTMRGLVTGIIQHENGSQPYDDATIDAGLTLAGLGKPRAKVARAQRQDSIAAAAGTIAAATAAVTSALEQITATVDAVDQASRPLGAYAAWLPAVAAVVAIAAIAFLTWRLLRRTSLLGA